MSQSLTEKQAAFVREYLKDFNATQAATRAGYAANSARQQGARLLSNAAVQHHLGQYAAKAKTEAVMSLTQLQEWWTDAVLGRHSEHGAVYRDQQKASEYLARSQSGFADGTEHSGDIRIRIIRD